MRLPTRPFAALIAVALVSTCDPIGGSPLFATSGLNLTFAGDSTFIASQAGRTVTAALVHDDTVVAKASTTVSTTPGDAFSFTFPGALTEGESYAVDYWIDSNIDGGSVGVCDPPPVDLTWQVSVAAVTGPVDIAANYDPTAVVDVCSAFQ
jgi:hypothetical protein